jgi:enterobactin synthetase component D
MIAGSLVTISPFAESGLIWRELRFLPKDITEMATAEDPLGVARVTLPPDLQTAVPKRRAEFLAGRLCAALALRTAGLPTDVPRFGRAPVWPLQVAGTISHSDSRAIAVISPLHLGLGVDCETLMPADQAAKLQREILSLDEIALRPAPMTLAAFTTLAFSAKESLYKALSATLSHIPGFHDVSLTGIAGDRLHLSFAGAAYQARFKLTGTDCLTLVAVPR